MHSPALNIRCHAVQFEVRKDGVALFEKMRKRVPASTWADVLKVLHLYAEDVLQDSDLVDMVSAACASPSGDLASQFADFMARCVPNPLIDARYATAACEPRLWPRRTSAALRGAAACRAPRLELSDEAVDAFTQALTQRTSRRSERDKYARCPVSDLDLSNCERCSPSYVRLPADYPKLTFTARCAPPPPLLLLPLFWPEARWLEGALSFRLPLNLPLNCVGSARPSRARARAGRGCRRRCRACRGTTSG